MVMVLTSMRELRICYGVAFCFVLQWKEILRKKPAFPLFFFFFFFEGVEVFGESCELGI